MSSPAKRQQTTKHNVSQVQTAWSGPLPAPEAVKRFDEIIPGGAERIFRMAELEQQHRIQTEQDALQANIAASKAEINAASRGAWMASLASTLAISGSIFTAYIGAHPSVSIALVSISVMGAVQAFLKRKS